MAQRALITGIAGQDGPYLQELLIHKGYKVIGIAREDADLTDAIAIERIISSHEPDEIYNLAGQSSVRRSFEDPDETRASNAAGAVNMLEAARKYRDSSKKQVKFFQATSSEMFGLSPAPQNELTPFLPQSPYGEAKVAAHKAVERYRRQYGLFAISGILFNHESPRRPETFVTRKITMAAARIKLGLQKELLVGNIEVQRDWGYAPEYMEACYLMMQADKPEDYVIGTGVAHSIRDFIEAAFSAAGISDFEKHIVIDPALYRSADVPLTVADPRKIKEKLGWQAKTPFKELVRMMVEADLASLGRI